MNGFYGTFYHTLDPKNRFFVPAKLRSNLGESFFITRKLTKPALVVYPLAEWEKLREKLNAYPDSEIEDIKQFIFSHSVCATPDSQGRILLPNDLTDYAGIDKEIAIVGVSEYVLIYAAETLAAEEKHQTENLEKMRSKFAALGL